MSHITAAAGARRLPNDPELELAFLGSCLLYWRRLGLGDGLAPELFWTPAHYRIAHAINEALERGELSAELVSSYTPQDAAVVVAAVTWAAGPLQALADLERLAELAEARAEAVTISERLDKLAPFERPGTISDAPNGKAVHGGEALDPPPRKTTHHDGEALPFELEVLSRRHNGSSAYVVKVAGESHPFTIHELISADASIGAWGRYSGARGYATRAVRERLANAVIAEGAKLELELVEHLEGAGELAQGADVAGWEAICLELERAPKAALAAGVSLASWFLKAAGMEHRLRPLGFCLHLWGDPRCGKDTIAEVAAAVVGNPGRWPAGLVGAFGGTANGLRLLADKAGAYPVIVTEVGIFNGKRGELQRAMWSMFEGARPVSSRGGELLARSLAYAGVALTNGNATICDGGEPALRSRVLELAGPLTVDEAQADKLRKLAFAHYGWPLARVRAGELGEDPFAAVVDRLAGCLLIDQTDPTVRDVARRCAVLVAGAGALGQLISDEHAELMEAAAYAGAEGLLEDLRQTLEDGGAGAGLAFLQAAWDDRSERLIDYPDPEGALDYMARVRGYYQADTDRLSLRPSVAHELAAAGGWSLELAVRQLRDLGLLVHRPGKLRNIIRRREDGRIKPYRVYTFEALPDDELGVDEPTSPESDGPRDTSDEPRAPEEPPRAPLEGIARPPRAPEGARDLTSNTRENAAARPARPLSRTRGLRGPLILGARGFVGPGGLLTEKRPLTLEAAGAMAAELERRVVMVHRGAELTGSSLFVDVGQVTFVFLAHDRGEVCYPFTQAADELELAEAVEVFEREVGFPWHSSVGRTAELLIMATHDPSRGGHRLEHNYDVPEPARVSGLEGPTLWRRPLEADEAAAGWVHGYDLHSQYLAAWGNVYLPFGAPELVQGPTFNPKREGLWRVKMPKMSPEGLLPAPWGQRDWYSTPTLERAVELLEAPLEPLEAWIWPEHRRYLYGAYVCLRDARATLAADPSPAARMALEAVKMVYRVGTGRFSYSGRTGSGSRWDRPEWGHWVRAKARVNQDRLLRKLERAPFAIATDGLFFASSSPDAAAFAGEIGLPLGEGLGCYSPTVTVELTPALAAAIDAARSPQRVVKALEQ